MKSKDLQFLTWDEVQKCLNSQTVVVVPLGSQCKEHGFHLPLNTDFVMAEKLKSRVEKEVEAVFAPTLNYSYYPAMVKYPGTVSLSYETTIGLISDICNSFKIFGVRKFYFLNTGISTLKPLKSASEQLAQDNVILHFTDLEKLIAPIKKTIAQQEGGGHADEIETSIMLELAPSIVKMDLAKKDFNGSQDGPLTPIDDGSGVYSPTGSWGDPTLATKDKGKLLVDALVQGIVREINELQLVQSR